MPRPGRSRASARPSPRSSASPRAGPKNTPTLVTNWTQYVDQFGDIETGSYLALAVYGYFLNGGGRCYIVRIGAEQPESKAQGKQPKQVTGSQTATIGNYVFTAKNATANAKAIAVEIGPADGDSPPDDEFKVTVNIEGKPPEVWGNVSSKPDSGNYVVNRVGGESKVVTVEAVLPDVQTKPKIGERRRSRSRSRRTSRSFSRSSRCRRPTTSGIPRIAPASADSKRSKTSRWSPSPT